MRQQRSLARSAELPIEPMDALEAIRRAGVAHCLENGLQRVDLLEVESIDAVQTTEPAARSLAPGAARSLLLRSRPNPGPRCRTWCLAAANGRRLLLSSWGGLAPGECEAAALLVIAGDGVSAG